MSDRPTISAEAMEQLKLIADEGLYNMFERSNVQARAAQLDYWELYNWIDDHREDYAALIFGSIEVEEDHDNGPSN
jgi:type V secretory pathway adhesin AidA